MLEILEHSGFPFTRDRQTSAIPPTVFSWNDDEFTEILPDSDSHYVFAKRAAEAVKLVNPNTVIPMHYGTYNLPGTPQAFAQVLKQQGVKSQLRVMKVGETVRL